ncbi:uncharacterized protein LOC117171501 [Belonocnema kinseyi]|uniref:uncharacterized protein LOC117171501 n=1 Tax=Belonocnema kinseyi TaxID=2817044 RepID=UPI00143DF2D9|nr:uncharacterized protein LOC117171501 [Belonocnema kinseyi]XP_033214758.1 uncharacterized protein LOC117171501 [Belonocnema kinseyi]
MTSSKEDHTSKEELKREKKEKDEIDFEDVEKLMVFAATRLQQNFYELLSDWNEYDPRKPHILKNCIGTALFGPPEAEENESLESVEGAPFLYKPAYKMKKIQEIYDKIVEHGTQNTKDKTILCSLMYNVTFHKNSVKAVIDKIKKADMFNGDCFMEYVQPVPFFKVLKNFVEKKDKDEKKDEKKYKKNKKVDEKMDLDKEKEEEKMELDKEDENEKEHKLKTTKVELYYIDVNARVYTSWSDYLTTNILPPCIMVVPYGGEYQGDEGEQWSEETSYVWVESHKSPACKTKYLGLLDTAATVVGLGSMGAALFNPVGASVAIAGAVVVGVTSLWTIGRSSQELVDRSKHDQSIKVTNKQGFTCWLGIASSTLAVASTGGSMLLSRAIKNGTSINKAAQITHDVVQFTTLGATGVGAGFSFYNIYDTYQQTNTVSKQEVLNLAATLLLLGNSVINLKLSKNIIESHQTSIIKDYETSLRSNRHRKEFQKMVRNTKSIVSDPTKAKEQIIRGINSIQNKDEFFSLILKNKKSFASEGVKPAFVEGKVTVNGKTLMNPVDFVKGITKTQNPANQIALKPVIAPSTSVVSIPNESIFESALANFIRRHTSDFLILITPKLSQFLHVLTDINSYDNPDIVFSKLLTLALKIAKVIIQDEYSATNILVRAVDFFWDFIKASVRETLSEMCGEARQYREVLMKILVSLYYNVEIKLDEWVCSFKEYLRIKFREVEDKVKAACSNQFERVGNASRSLMYNCTTS